MEDLIKQADKLKMEKQNHLSQSLDIERQVQSSAYEVFTACVGIHL